MKTIQDAIYEINSKLSTALDEIILDGKIHRFGNKNSCWYAGHEWEYKGNMYQSVTYCDWKNGEEITWKSYDKKLASDKAFNKAYQKSTKENQEKIKEEKENLAQKCKDKWKPIFNSASSGSVHDYLKNKSIEKSYVSRVDYRNTLLIPVYDKEGFTGVQMIFEDGGEYIKRYSTGIKKQGGICPLIPFKKSEYVYLSEGFATAASIQMAYPEIPSICAFDAGNLTHAIKTIRAINPSCKIIIAADNDSNNKGEFEAKKCSKQYKDVIFKTVKFSEGSPKEWTDYNDLHCFNGLEYVVDQLKIMPEEFSKIECLGHNEETGYYYYISSENSQIIPLPASAHNKSGLKRLIASETYWYKNFGAHDEETGKSVIKWDTAQSFLMDACHKAGEFDFDRIRGTGVWVDQGHYVFNDGNDPFNVPKNSQYIYRKGDKMSVGLVNNLDEEDVLDGLKKLRIVFDNLCYKNKNDSIILASWVIQSQIFATLPWRFHVWLTGDKGTGKSSIMEKMAALCPTMEYTDDATEAGISQTIKSNATSVIYDEIESPQRQESIKSLIRRMSNNKEAKKLRGTSGGSPIKHNTQAIFLLGSIRVEKMDSADRSRIFVVNMASTKDQKPEVWVTIESAFNFFIKNKSHLFTACYNNIETILNNKIFINAHLKRTLKMESRYADQLSTLIACFHVYSSFNAITAEEIDGYMNDYELMKSDYMEQNETDDAEDSYNDLMTTIIDNHGSITIERAIESIKSSEATKAAEEYNQQILWAHGLHYIKNKNKLFISNPNKLKNLEKKIGNLAFYNVLKRNDAYCYKKRDVQKIYGKSEIGILLSLKT